MTYILKPQLHHPNLPTNARGFTRRDYEGSVSTLCAGCGHDFDLVGDHPGGLRTRPAAAPDRQALRHRLLVEDARLFHGREPRLQHRARPNALGPDRREPRQQGPDLPGRFRRRRQRLHRPWPVRPRRAARREHALHRREQRGLRPDQGPVLGHLRQGLEVQEGRGQPRRRHRPGRHGPAARRHLRRPLVLRRQGPAGAADQGRPGAQGRGLHRRASAPACSSTTTSARPRASTMCASTTRR